MIQSDVTQLNPDGSSRRVISHVIDRLLNDGNTNKAHYQQSIVGSSNGAKMADGSTCTNPLVSSTIRFYGNRAIVDASLRSHNVMALNYSITNGTFQNTFFQKRVEIAISDPSKVANYAIITGPGLPSSGFKLISPRLLNSEQRLANSPKYFNLPNTFDWLICRPSNNYNETREASTADCVNYPTDWPNKGVGAGVDLTNPTSASNALANLETAFNGLGFQAGGSYTIKIYADDGWATVNGQAGKTPVASYTRVLNALPYAFNQLPATVASYLTMTNTSSSTVFSLLSSNQAIPLSYTVPATNPVVASSSDRLTWGGVWIDREGTVNQTLANDGSNFWPQTIRETDVYMATKPTGAMMLTSPAPGAGFTSPTWFGAGVWYSSQNGNTFNVRMQYQ